jgi:hypothetical protein
MNTQPRRRRTTSVTRELAIVQLPDGRCYPVDPNLPNRGLPRSIEVTP